MKYRITLIESDEGWAAWCDDLPGCCTQGETRNQAIENMHAAIEEWLAVRDEEIRADGAVRSVIHEEIFV